MYASKRSVAAYALSVPKAVPICSPSAPYGGDATKAAHPHVKHLAWLNGETHFYPSGRTNRYERVQCLGCDAVMTFPVNAR